MKHSQTIGIAALLLLFATNFLPWVYIASVNITATGFNGQGTTFGKPGLLSTAVSAVALVLFLLPKIWAKRVNMFMGVVVFAWAVKNYLLMTSCLAGDCPEKRAGIYLQLLFGLIVFIMTLLPKLTIPAKEVA